MRKPRLMNRRYWMNFSVTSMHQPATENRKKITMNMDTSVRKSLPAMTHLLGCCMRYYSIFQGKRKVASDQWSVASRPLCRHSRHLPLQGRLWRFAFCLPCKGRWVGLCRPGGVFQSSEGHHNRSQRERFHSALRAEFHLATAKFHPPQVDFTAAERRRKGVIAW